MCAAKGNDGQGNRRDGRAGRFQPRAVDSTSAADHVTQQLRLGLVQGRLRPGDRLGTEPEMAIQFGVSRATVREAIKSLRAQGVLRTQRGAKGGHFIITPQTDVLAESMGETYGLWFDAGDVSIAEVDEARYYVERACVRLAAERRRDEDLKSMKDIIDSASDPSISLAEFLELDVRFHGAIALAARNRLLELPMSAIHRVRPKTNRVLRKHDRSRVMAQHTALYQAIASGKVAAAEAALQAHLRYLGNERNAALEARHRSDDLAVREISD